MKKTSKNSQSWPHSESKHPRAHLHPHLFPCNKLHDHHQTHTYRVSSVKKITTKTRH